MKIGLIIPDRGDRPDLLRNCIRMMERQTLLPSDVYVVGHKPADTHCDITKRYRNGYEYFHWKGFDIIALIENDDFYSTDYLSTMISGWKAHGKPDLFGNNFTIYYHLRLAAWKKMIHHQRASAMNTLIKPDLIFEWCSDFYPYTDIHLWSKLKGVSADPGKIISIGMKHGQGMCGGAYHNDRLNRFVNEDHDLSFLKTHLDNESFAFYSKYRRDVLI